MAMEYYLFTCVSEDEYEGESFIVCAENFDEARAIALDEFGDVEFNDMLTEDEVDACGLDVF